MLLSFGIIMIEVLYTTPLLMLNYVKGDAWLETDYENPTFKNVRLIYSYIDFIIM